MLLNVLSLRRSLQRLGQEAMQLMRTTMGEHDGLVAATGLGLAEVLLHSGKLEAAEVQYRAALALQVQAQGEDNPDTIRAARQLALVRARELREGTPLCSYAKVMLVVCWNGSGATLAYDHACH